MYPDRKPDYTIIHIESNEHRLELKDDEAVIYDSWKDNISFDLYHLAYSISRIDSPFLGIRVISARIHTHISIIGHIIIYPIG